jgi:hypothetical protein
MFAQHTVNDLKDGDWYKLRFEMDSNKINYFIVQCYPNGDEYVVTPAERSQLPLFMKVFCLALSDELLNGMAQSLSFNEDGVFMQLTGFSFIISFDATEEELLETIGSQIVEQYKDKDW